MRKYSLYILSLLASLLVFSACEESEEVGEYDNWKGRNQQFVDSIASLAKTGADGWTKIVAYNLNDSIEALNPDNVRSIYVQKLENGSGTYKPQFNDSIRIHYLGRLMPSANYPEGFIFDKSYTSYTLNEATDVPALLAVRDNIVGFATATMHMVEGDRWKIVVPYYLGYGVSTKNSAIPPYSTLIFDVKLAKAYRYRIDTNTAWH